MIPSITLQLAFPLAALAVSSGATGKLSSLDGGLEGTVTVVNNTAVMISGYQLKDASAPALHWWGVKGDEDLSKGFRVNNERVSKDTPDATDITVMLDAGKTAADFDAFGLWCEQLHANFGQASLTGDSSSSSSSDDDDSASSSSSTASSTASAASETSTGAASVMSGYRTATASVFLSAIMAMVYMA